VLNRALSLMGQPFGCAGEATSKRQQPSFLRKQESRFFNISWTPAFAGVTTLGRGISLEPTLPASSPRET
jgi:hypothetical protein